MLFRSHEVKFVKGTYVAPSQDVINIDLSGATIKAGNRYVLRVVYKDLYEHPGQFTHTYEVIATATTPATLASAFAAKISKHMNRRVVATVSSAIITLTAMAKDDNEGVNALAGTVSYIEASMLTTVYSLIEFTPSLSSLTIAVKVIIAELTVATTLS